MDDKGQYSFAMYNIKSSKKSYWVWVKFGIMLMTTKKMQHEKEG